MTYHWNSLPSKQKPEIRKHHENFPNNHNKSPDHIKPGAAEAAKSFKRKLRSCKSNYKQSNNYPGLL